MFVLFGNNSNSTFHSSFMYSWICRSIIITITVIIIAIIILFIVITDYYYYCYYYCFSYSNFITIVIIVAVLRLSFRDRPNGLLRWIMSHRAVSDCAALLPADFLLANPEPKVLTL